VSAVVAALAAISFAPMAVEAVIAARHDAHLRQLGAVEPARDVFRAMQLAYPAAFAVMVIEAWLRHVEAGGWFYAGLTVFGAAKLLKYWAIATLGERWTFRVLVPPRSARIVTGPYRWLRHPNYAAVMGELLGIALAAHALVTGPIATAGFALLILRRIVVEERALGLKY
jgi:methyltransferase